VSLAEGSHRFELNSTQRNKSPIEPRGVRPAPASPQEMMYRGGSVIVSPLGDVIAGPFYDEEGILYANLDLGEIVKAKLDFDVVGHYARPDVFQLIVNEQSASGKPSA